MRLPFPKSCGWRRCVVFIELRVAVWCYSAHLCGFLRFRVPLGCSPSAPARWNYCEAHVRDTVGVSYRLPETAAIHTAQIRDALVELEQNSKSDPALRHECRTLIDSVSDFTNIVAMVVWYDVLFQVNAISNASNALLSKLLS
jgi:predicted secreted protein